MTFRSLILASACLSLSACAPVLSSHDVNALGGPERTAGLANGEVYYLPKAVVTAHVRVSNSRGVQVVLDQPTLIAANMTWSPDPGGLDPALSKACEGAPKFGSAVAGPFVLKHHVTGVHKDEITVEVDNSLLKSANGKSDEQISLILSALAKSAGSFVTESALQGDEVEVATISFDPADCLSVALANQKIKAAVDGPGLALLNKGKAAADIVTRAGDFRISLARYQPFRFSKGAPTAADCAKGVCVPVLTPAVLAITNGASVVETAPFNIPNLSDPAVIPINRSPFATVDTKLTFSSGVLTKRTVTRDSEVLTLVTIPGAVVGAYLDAVAGAFTKRKTVAENEKAYLTAIDALAKAEADREKAATRESAIQGPPLASIRVAGTSWLPRASATPPLEQNPDHGLSTESNDGQK